MQFEKAIRRRKAWGDKPCNHPLIDKEQMLGGPTEDYVCVQCGKVINLREWEEGRKPNQHNTESSP
jgi:hypothetical protein